ncbi:MAG: J domain-containing protein [Deltaproteobacteria bacterium]|nr:J domain-containing protein [Deltaproteobacteria bacterium]
MKNPFAVFGLTPEIVKALSNDQLKDLVRSNYRILLKAFHPDTGGKGERCVELNLAYESVNNKIEDEGFQYWRDKYEKSSSRRGRTKSLTRKLVESERNEDAVQQRFLDFISVSQKGRPDCRTIFNLRCSLVRVQLCDIIIREDGAVEYKLTNRRQIFPAPQVTLLGTIPPGQINIRDYLLHREEAPVEQIPSFITQARALPNRFFTHLIDYKTFSQQLLRHLTPYIREGDHLFSDHSNPSFIIYEGTITSIKNLPPVENR